MKSFVSKAQAFYEKERANRRENFDIEEFGMPKIVVVGCGGSGNNTVNRLKNIGVDGVTTIAINTDKQHLMMIKADKKVLIGRSLTKGLGAGGYPEIGRKAAELARGTFEELLSGADLVFVCAGMGGGTGTGSAPVVAEIAKKQGAIVIGMVQTPFRVERARILKAEEGLEELRKHADTVVVLDNNKLLEYVPNLPIEQAFSVMDQLVAETIKGISDTITKPSLMNIDFADVRAVMGHGGVAVMLVGEAKSQNKAKEVVRDCLNHPLLDVDYRGATGALIHISGGPDLTIKEAEEIVENLTFEIDAGANVIWGARIERELEGIVKVMAIMTGVQSPNILACEEELETVEEKPVEKVESFNGRKIHRNATKVKPLRPKVSVMGIDVL
ncbi:cell division protein FtsZ [Archaeoglobus veneficus]|uniref:Cell division protein FtsZ n=1 Tax=Archaeoglobus veneficus (strain DSM 11195 / SNP6) TaxID=693661 RepID=F2KP85_ARCVS|nr:cell division protein FtsZ [Archaeoglobus veneficus]AEA47489.1 cell division protein FtsZ [Archaeoglobus veneficus SNP6]